MFFHKVLRRKRRIFQGNFSPAGLTFLEIIISLTLISVGMLLYLEIFNTAMDAHSRSIREIISTNLAQGLMAEIMAKNFEEPGAPPLGPDDGETDRSNFDDVDDFIGYAETPPHTVLGADMDGTAGTPDYSGFRRSVTVSYCDIIANPEPPPDEIIVDVAGPTVYKHIKVTVSIPYGAGFRDISTIDEVKVNPNP